MSFSTSPTMPVAVSSPVNRVGSGSGGESVPADAVFVSDWSTGTGTGDAALRDTGKTLAWTILYGGAAVGSGGAEVRVTATDSRDFPSTNYMRIRALLANLAWAEISVEDYTSAPGVGDSIYIRYYARLTMSTTDDYLDITTDPDDANPPETGDATTHGYYTGDGWGPEGHGFTFWTADDGSWRIEYAADNSQAIFSEGTNGSGNGGAWRMARDTTYRLEKRYTRTGTNTYTMDLRVYNIAGTLLFDGTDVTDWPGPNTIGSLDGATFTVTGAAAQGMVDSFRVGCNGIGGIDSDRAHSEVAGVMIRTEDWCGPYIAAESDF